jgi:hypothetical protein
LEFLKLLNIAQSASVPNGEAVAIEMSAPRGSIRKAFGISESFQYRAKRWQSQTVAPPALINLEAGSPPAHAGGYKNAAAPRLYKEGL